MDGLITVYVSEASNFLSYDLSDDGFRQTGPEIIRRDAGAVMSMKSPDERWDYIDSRKKAKHSVDGKCWSIRSVGNKIFMMEDFRFNQGFHHLWSLRRS